MSAVPMSPALVPISASSFLRSSVSFGRSPHWAFQPPRDNLRVVGYTEVIKMIVRIVEK